MVRPGISKFHRLARIVGATALVTTLGFGLAACGGSTSGAGGTGGALGGTEGGSGGPTGAATDIKTANGAAVAAGLIDGARTEFAGGAGLTASFTQVSTSTTTACSGGGTTTLTLVNADGVPTQGDRLTVVETACRTLAGTDESLGDLTTVTEITSVSGNPAAGQNQTTAARFTINGTVSSVRTLGAVTYRNTDTIALTVTENRTVDARNTAATTDDILTTTYVVNGNTSGTSNGTPVSSSVSSNTSCARGAAGTTSCATGSASARGSDAVVGSYDLTATITAPVTYAAGADRPNGGQIQIRQGNETATVTYSATGLTIVDAANGTNAYTWAQYEALLDSLGI